MIIASDVTTLKERGKYNGFIGASVAVGNGLGPLIGGVVTERASWQWCLWFIVPVIIVIMILLALVIPKSRVPGGSWMKIKMIDWVGLVISIAAVLLLLVSLWHCLDSEERSMSHLTWLSKLSLISAVRYQFPRVVQHFHGAALSLWPCSPSAVP